MLLAFDQSEVTLLHSDWLIVVCRRQTVPYTVLSQAYTALNYSAALPAPSRQTATATQNKNIMGKMIKHFSISQECTEK